jgi:phytoene dehydrogenase-like protein
MELQQPPPGPTVPRSKLAGMRGVLTGFLPWAIYWIAAGMGFVRLALVGRLMVSAIQNAGRVRGRRYKTLELATLAYSVLDVVVTLIAGSHVLRTYGDICVNGVLAAMAFGSLAAASPFTYEYARESWPKEYWQDPIFRRTNEIITAIWGIAFSLCCTGACFSHVWSGHSALFLGVVPAVVNLAAALFSMGFPERFPRYAVARQLRAAAPFAWEVPHFAGTGHPEGHDVIVIGAGIGGLAAGALLAKRGLRVLVLEQHGQPGGYCSSWQRRTPEGIFLFDAGVHDISGLGPRGPVRNLLEQLGLEQEIEWLRVRQEYVAPGLRIKVPEGAPAYIELLARRFPAEREGIGKLFAEIEAIYEDMYADVDRTGGVPRPPRTVEDMLAYPRTHPHLARWYGRPFGSLLDAFVVEPRLKVILCALSAYLTDQATILRVQDMVPLFGYVFHGGFYPKGGSQRLADALVESIRRSSGQVLLGTGARSIRVTAGAVQGVETVRGDFHQAPVVISNADAKHTLLELVGKDRLPRRFARRIEATIPSASAFAVFLGVDFQPEVEAMAMVLGSVGVCVPSKLDPSLAPPGHASISLFRLVSAEESRQWDRSAPDYADRKRRWGDDLITRAEALIPNLRAHIVYRDEATPATFARYTGAAQGAIYGLARGQLPIPTQSPIRGLFLVGAAVYPGAGIEAVVISGTSVADRIRPAIPAQLRTKTFSTSMFATSACLISLVFWLS